MASTYVNNLRLNEMATGDQSGTWGTTTNTNLELIGQALGWGTRAIANASTDNITIADGASDADRSMALKLTGGGQACTVTILPNTSSKVWIMENATAATLTFTAGSGANVAILAGETKMIATDGLGSGGVVYDVLTDLNLAGTTKTAALTNAGLINTATLTTTSNVIIGGNASLTGGSYFAAESYRYTDGTSALTIGSGGLVTAVSGITSTAAANTFGATSFNDANITNVGSIALDTITNDGTDITLDSSGDINLDADGGDIRFKDAGTAVLEIKNESGSVDFSLPVTNDDFKFKGVDDGSTITALLLDMSAAGEATFNGKIIADAGIDIDNFNIDGTTIALSSGDMVLDSAGDISLDADGGDIRFKDGGTEIGAIVMDDGNNTLIIQSTVADADIKLTGNDGGSGITALLLDMSAAGAATFNDKITAVGTSVFTNLDISGDVDVDGTLEADAITLAGTALASIFSPIAGGGSIVTTGALNSGSITSGFGTINNGSSTITTTGTVATGAITAGGDITRGGSVYKDGSITDTGDFTLDVAGDIVLDADGADIILKDGGTSFGELDKDGNNFRIKNPISDGDVLIQGNDGGSIITALTLDMSAAGAATFNNDVTAFSDERLKSNITTIPDALSKVSEMRGVHYVRNETGKDSSGVIAQEMQKVAPELVLTADDEMGTLSVNYGNITGYLIEAIKELKAEIEELKAR